MLDRVKLTDCLARLIASACQFTRDGLVTLRVWSEAERIVFEITDSSVGMTRAVRARLFEPLVEANTRAVDRPAGDAGAGLAVARKNARLMGGDIAVESVAGRGSTFTLWLPLSTFAAREHAEIH